jgi:hypothetical protein
VGRGSLDRGRVLRTARQGPLDALTAAVPGRQAVSMEASALVVACEEITRLKAAIADQAVALHLDQGRRTSRISPTGPAASASVRAGNRNFHHDRQPSRVSPGGQDLVG